MAYDLALAGRVRSLALRRKGIDEKQMFGGLAFLLDGKMFVGVLGKELLARVGPDGHEGAIARPHVRIMDFTGRPMRGYVFVGPEALEGEAALKGWFEQCLRHAATLPRRKKGKEMARSRSAKATKGRAGAARRRP
jgi:hypothetical protein